MTSDWITVGLLLAVVLIALGRRLRSTLSWICLLLVFGLARDGLGPRALARVNAGGTPWTAMILVGVVASTLAAIRRGKAVALAEGVTPRGFNGYDPAAFMPSSTEAEARAAVAAMVEFNRPSAKTHSGVWRDLAIRKRRTEVDVQIAPISEVGAKHGVPCPTIDRLVAMIHEVEAGTRALHDDNLLELMAS